MNAVALSRAMGFMVVAMACGCGGKATGIVEPPAAPGDTVSFAFRSLDAKPADADSYRGKPLVLSFFATGDISSQAQTNYLVAMASHDVGKVSYLLVAMEPPSQRELIELYRQSLKVTFAVSIADEKTLSGQSKFGPVNALPTIVVIDASGKIAMRADGRVVPAQELREVLNGLK